jgi:hypothetical protein
MNVQYVEYDYSLNEQLYLHDADEELERSTKGMQRWISILVLASTLVFAVIALLRLV